MNRAGKKKIKKRVDPVAKTVTFSLKDFNDLIADVRLEATQKTGILYLVKLADMGFTEDDIVDVFKSIMIYVNALDDHIVQIREVEEIIERKTGIRIEWE